MARGQTIDDVLAALPPATKAEHVRYWFDDDPASLATLQQMKGEQQIDASSLVEGLHTLHLQIEDENGAVCSPRSSVFLKFNSVSTIAPAAQLRYWFDDIPSVTTVSATLGLQPLDVSALIEGLHTLHFQVVDVNGKAGHVMSSVFLKFNHVTDSGNVQAKNLLYWFDDATDGMVSLPMTAGVQQIDASALVEGLHTLHYQVVCNDGSLTSAHSSVFLKMNFELAQTKAQRLRYWFDDLATVQETEVLKGAQLLDASMLTEGLHTLHYQVVNEMGAVCSPKSAVFLKMNADVSQSVAKTQRYWFDDDPTTMHEQPVTAGTQMLDVDGLLTGLHTLHYQLTDETGRLAPPRSAVFVKMPERTIAEGENRITQYMYWTNDYSQDNVKVVLPQPASSYQLISLLPTVKAPIRSSMFHFEVTDGQPTIYAKNDIHVRFYDAAGYWADDARAFIDYAVCEAIRDIAELQTSQTFERPAENGIRWFQFEAEYGDSIALKTNQPVSIQVFDATGKEVYATSADKSVRYDGCHLLANGTCYVAVHDVTGTGSNVTLDAQFIDKFALFDYTPGRFASTGKTLMAFNGNGLEHVKKVELTNGETTFAADTIIATTDRMMARFSLNEQVTSARLFTLNVYFHNVETDESKTLSYANGVALMPANNVPLMTVEVVTEKRVGDPYPIKVTLKNEGNVPQYGIPLNIAFDNVDKFDEILFSDFDLLLSDSLFERKDFCTYTDNLVGTGQKGFFLPLLIPYMGPNETRTYSFGVRTKIPHAKFNFYAWAGKAWFQLEMKTRSQQNSNMHDVYDRVDVADHLFDLPISPSNVARPFLAASEAISGFIQGSTRAREDMLFDNMGIDPSERDQYRFNYKYKVRSPRDIAVDGLGLPLPDVEDVAEGLDPQPTPHPVDVYIPGDPNEMTGYSAPSGSRYMSDEVKTIGYDIEFENDPEIANSSAHRIVIENQLDPTKFDLKTFTPKDITLSGKKVELDGEKSFVKTIDLRPQINALAQLECDYSVQTGVARWTFTSLDPMTMEPTDDIMQGVLPVNYDGTSGIGNVTYTVDLLRTFPDGTEVANSASIIFDNNDPIVTPVWVNTVDAVRPTGRVATATVEADTTAVLTFEGDDARSGMWRYDVYMQRGSDGVWEKAGECLADSTFTLRIQDGTDYGFCAIAIDSAGNVEVKDMLREAELVTYVSGDANGDGVIDIEDVVTAVSHYLGEETPILFRAADVNGDGVIDIEDVVGIREIYLGAATPQAARLRSTTKRQRLRTVMQQ